MRHNVTRAKNKHAEKEPNIIYALNINCICGGKFIPFTHKNNDININGYRCNKCGKDIITKIPVI